MHKLNICMPYKCYKNEFIKDHSCSAFLYTTNCNPKRHQSVQISKSFGLQPVTTRQSTTGKLAQRLRPLGHEGLMVISGLMSYRIMGYKF